MDLLETGLRPPSVGAPPAPHRLRSVVRWGLALGATALFLSTLGWLIDDQVREHDQADRARTALHVTRHKTADVTQQLTKLRHDVDLLVTQVGSDSTAYDQVAAQLKAAQSELAATQVDVSQQNSRISALHTCLGGVQKALNALAVGSQANAITELSSVNASCSTASGG
jgi:septal ring factor EnvC (AmiA/AmiB activator)